MTDAALKPRRMRTVIRAYDLEVSTKFYRDQLGLSVIESWDRADGAGCLLDAGGGVIELLGKTPGDAARGGWDFIMPIAKYDILLEVENAQAAYDAVKAKGIEPLGPLETTAWGSLRFTVNDPDETPIVFMQTKT